MHRSQLYKIGRDNMEEWLLKDKKLNILSFDITQHMSDEWPDVRLQGCFEWLSSQQQFFILRPES